MNKYSKRALKTTATVGMSLAMVLSAVTPAMAYTAPEASVIDSAVAANNFLGKLNDYLTANGIDYLGLQVNGKTKDGSTEETLLTFDATSGKLTDTGKVLAAATKAMNYFNYKTEEYDELYYFTQVSDKINDMAVTATGIALSTIDDGLITSATDEESLIGKLAKAIDTVETEGTSATKVHYEAVNTALDDVIKVEAYEGALPDDEVATGDFDIYSKTTYLAIKELAQEMIDEYFGDTHDSNLKGYVKELKDDFKTFFGANNDVYRTSKTIAAEIKRIKNTADYKRYDDEDAVTSILDNYDEMLEAAKAVEEVTNVKFDATVALMKTKAKYDFNENTASKTLSSLIKTVNKDVVIDYVDADTFAIIKEYKEEVLDVVAEFKTDKVGKTYFEDTKKTQFAKSDDVDKLFGYLSAKDSAKDDLGLLEIADSSTGDRYYDLIETRMTDVKKALTDVTTALKGISVNNLTSANIGKVNDAAKAIKLLDDKYAGNLTGDETDTVEDQKEFVGMLRTYALLNGIVSGTTTGWVDLGNGNWDFYLENGDAPTKWVAAGSDWYYVKNAHMLRNTWVAQDATGAKWYYVDNAGKMVSNTTIDGFVIDANGVWTK